MITNAALVLGLLAASPAFGVVNTSVATGVRGADFDHAPTDKGITLTELDVRVASDALLPLPFGIGIGAGLGFAYESMRGSLGQGLESFSGVSYGPEIRAEMAVTPRVKPFLSVGYRLGRYTGRGSANWSDDTVPALFLYPRGVNEAKEKRFASSGAHVSLGASARVWEMLSAAFSVDLGFEKMSTDTRVIDGAEELPNRTDGSFGSRAFLVGARVDL